jgi:hypothetical protein
MLIYILSFTWLNNQKNSRRFDENSEIINDGSSDSEVSIRSKSEKEEEQNAVLNLTNLKIVLPKAFNLIINLFSVYFFEYSCINCFADRMGIKMKLNYPEDVCEYRIMEFTVILNFCY